MQKNKCVDIKLESNLNEDDSRKKGAENQRPVAVCRELIRSLTSRCKQRPYNYKQNYDYV